MNAYADPAIQQWNLQILASVEEAQAWVAQWQERWQAETDGCWAVTDGDTDEVPGRLALRDISLPGGRAQCTYWVLPAARGRGVATRATAELARWALDGLELHRLELMHSIANPPSCRVADKAGFTLEGTLRSALAAPRWVARSPSPRTPTRRRVGLGPAASRQGSSSQPPDP
jgi:ribosomal-protein-alanine N-acetyltransferase